MYQSLVIAKEELEICPLFLGLSTAEINEIIHKVHISPKMHKKGSIIAEEGAACDCLLYITDGWIEIETTSDDKSYKLKELLQAKHLVEPDKLYGLKHSYNSTYKAYTACTSYSINKDSFMKLMRDYLIVRINVMNIICRNSQTYEHLLWGPKSNMLEKQIIQFIKQRCTSLIGRKTLYIKMTQLAHELNATRLEVSGVLNKLADEEKIILKRGIIDVPALQLL